MDNNLQSYIATCRTQGFTDEEIQAELFKAGWSASQVAEAFPTTAMHHTPAAVLPPVNEVQSGVGRKRLLLWVGGGIALAVLLIFGGLVAYAEQGYMPAFSKLYRKTALPLAWHGTYGNAAVSLGKMLVATSQGTISSSTTSMSISLDKVNSSQNVQLGLLNTQMNKAFADVPQGCVTNCDLTSDSQPNFSLDSLFPAKIGVSNTIKVDAANAVSSTGSTDLTAFDKVFPTPAQTPTAQSVITTSFMVFPSDHVIYAKSNLIPYATALDNGKWLQFELPADVATSLNTRSQSTTSATVSAADQQKVADLVNANTVDDGIIREDGAAYAQYKTHVTGAQLKQIIAALPDLKKYFTTDITSAITDDLAVDITTAISPRSALLHSMQVTLSNKYPTQNISSSVTISESVLYGQVAIPKPDSTTVLSDGKGYVTQAISSAASDIENNVPISDPDWFGNSKVGLGLQDMVKEFFPSGTSEGGATGL